MNDLESGFQLRDLTGFLRRRLSLLGLTILAGLIAAGGVVLVTPTSYTSTARLSILPITSDPFAPNFRPLDAINITTEINLAKSDQVAGAVQKSLGLKASPKALLGRLTVVNPQGSLLFDITYKGSSPAAARAGAEAFAHAYLAQRKSDAEADKSRRAAQLRDQLAQGQAELAAAIHAENAVTSGSGQGPAATARRQTATNNLGIIGAKLNEIQSIDTDPGRVIIPASPAASSVGSTTLLTAVGVAGVIGLLGLVYAWVVDRRDPEVGGPSRIGRMSPATAIRFLPTSDGKNSDPLLVDAAIDRLAIDLVGAGGPTGEGPRTALLVGTDDLAPAGLGEEVAASLSYSGTPALFVVAGSSDLEVRHATPVHSFAALAANGSGSSALRPASEEGAGPPVTWLRPSAAAEASGLLRRSVVLGLVEQAAAEGFEVVVFLAPSPVRRAVSSALAQWVDRVVVVVERPTANGAAEATVRSLLDVDVIPDEVVFS